MNTTPIHAYLEALKKREEAGPLKIHMRPAMSFNERFKVVPVCLAEKVEKDCNKLRAMVECLLEAVEKIANIPRPPAYGWLLATDASPLAQDALTRVGQMVGNPLAG